jgi:hypothetical protein
MNTDTIQATLNDIIIMLLKLARQVCLDGQYHDWDLNFWRCTKCGMPTTVEKQPTLVS